MKNLSIDARHPRPSGKCGGCDRVQGPACLELYVGSCIRERIRESGYCADCLRPESSKGLRRHRPECGVRALQSGDERWNGKLRSGFEPSQRVDCHERKVSGICEADACDNGGHGGVGRISHVRHLSQDGNRYQALRMQRVLYYSQEVREAICSEVAHGCRGPLGSHRRFGFVHEPSKVFERWYGSWPQDVESCATAERKLQVSRAQEPAGQAMGPAVLKSIERNAELALPFCRFVLDPPEEERERGGPDVIDSVGCALHIARGWGADAKALHPKAQTMPAINRFGRVVVEREDDEREPHASDAHKNCSPLPHCWTLPLQQLNRPAN